MNVEARLQALEDREAIRDLLMEYRRALDEKDFDAYADLFGEDGEFVTDGFTVRGRSQILTMLADLQATGALTVNAGDDRHLVTNVEIEVDGDRATARSTWVYVTRESDEPNLAMVGHYEDQLRRTPAGWRFARRAAPRDIP
ncbi:nuclear transport factor 2 family protein [Solirubrobacter soli]|uniref:nuclear transport factor 2 family protein n=1 Tax=Solirubrobacter soli TaxID=363832 RepID=UPI0004100377|nr:nuclear transport factor 2 family protein [Solirubrobacter soli]